MGLVALLEAIKCQISIAQEMNKTVAIGLMRLSLQVSDNAFIEFLIFLQKFNNLLRLLHFSGELLRY